MVRLVFLLSLCLAAEAVAAVTCELAPADIESGRPDAYARASLTVEHDSPATVRAVALRAASGGPWLMVPMIAPPGRTGPKAVRLPATSEAMTFVVRGFADPDADPRRATPLFETRAALDWPADRVAVAPVLHPAVANAFGEQPVACSADLKAQILILLATGTVLGAYGLLARQPWLRALLVVALAAGMSAAVVGIFRVTPRVASRTTHVIVRDEGRSWMTTLTRLAARRTTTVHLAFDGPTWCAYADIDSMFSDQTVLRSTSPSVLADTSIVCPLRPGRPRVLLTTTPPPPGAPLPATVTVRQVDGARTLTSDRDTPAAIWIEGDRAARIEPLTADTPHTLDVQTLQPFDQLDPSGLLSWWAQTSRAADVPRLVWITTLNGRTALYICDVATAPSPVTPTSRRRPSRHLR